MTRALIIVSSANGAAALPVGMRVLKRVGGALDAVEAATRVLEDDPTDVTVGTGGRPG